MEYALRKLNDRELNGQRVQLREVSKFSIMWSNKLTSFRTPIKLAVHLIVLVPDLAAVALLVVVAVHLLALALAVPLVVAVALLPVLDLALNLTTVRDLVETILPNVTTVVIEDAPSLNLEVALALLFDLLANLVQDPLLVAKEGKVECNQNIYDIFANKKILVLPEMIN